LPKEKININIGVSTTVVQGSEVKLPFLKCEAFVDAEDDSQEFEPVRGFIEIEVMDKDGLVVQKGKHKMRSFVNNILRILEGLFKATGGVALGTSGVYVSTSVVKQDGSSATAYVECYVAASGFVGGGTPMGTMAGDNVDTYGIVVGSGTTPVNLNTCALSAKISHGTGSGQLDYDAVVIEALGLDTSVSPPVFRFRIVRGFKNVSGGPVSINEVGLLARSLWGYGTTILNDVIYLIAKDVLPTTYTVPDGGSATVTITVEVVLG
jgi:hypothetical protein